MRSLRSRPVHARPTPPIGEVIASGHVWPLVEGRSTFAEISGGRLLPVEHPRRWASGALETEVLDGDRARWVLHTRPSWGFRQTEPARQELITVVRRMRSLEPWLAPARRSG